LHKKKLKKPLKEFEKIPLREIEDGDNLQRAGETGPSANGQGALDPPIVRGKGDHAKAGRARIDVELVTLH
jgi:hypothetical protein